MFWRYRNCNKFALCAITAGTLLILALLVPPGFWLFVLGIALIVAGLLTFRN